MRKASNITCCFFTVLCPLCVMLAACASPAVSPPASNNQHSLSTSSGPISYSTSPNEVLVRTFHGGGNQGTLEISPEISIYGDGTYILGPGLQMRRGKLDDN